jgi:hypothetical protein
MRNCAGRDPRHRRSLLAVPCRLHVSLNTLKSPLSPVSLSPLEPPMARIGRFVVPELPRHVTQRDNRRERAFFADADYELHRDLLRGACAREGVAV